MSAALDRNGIPGAATGLRGRSRELIRQLDLARAGGRSAALEGHVGDVLVAESGEVVRLLEFLALWSKSRGSEVVTLGNASGAKTLTPPGSTRSNPRISLQPGDLNHLLDQMGHLLPTRVVPTTVVIDFCCLELGADPFLLRGLLELSHDPAVTAGHHQLVLVFRTGPPPPQLTTQPGWTTIAIDLPDQYERHFVLSRADRSSPIPIAADLSVEHMSTILGGIDNDAILRLVHEARRSAPVTKARLVELKAAEIRRMAGGTLIVDNGPPPNGLAGMANLRLHVDRCEAADDAVGAVVLAGVPGVGKTYSWRWLAWRLGLPAVRFGQLRGPFVGETERAMQRARRTLKAMSPCVVLIDEVDQAGLGRRGVNLDGGVSDHLRTEMFEMLNDCEEDGNVFVLATNNPAGVDPAALDRVTVLPVLHPGLGDAVEIMRLSAERQNWELDLDGARAVLAGHDLLTGRQIIRLLKRANLHAAAAGRPRHVTVEDLRVESADTIEQVNRTDHEFMGLSAVALADAQSALPWIAAARMGEESTPPSYIQPFLERDGSVDMTRLQAHVAHLRQAGHGFHT